MRGQTTKLCPPLNRSLISASFRTTASQPPTKVRTASLSTGGVAISDISRTPDNASCNVRGIGVAERVRTWTSPRNSFNRSFCATPKFCSSSIISKPKWLKSIDLASNACVPITIWTAPSLKPSLTLCACLGVTMRDRLATFTGKPLKRSSNNFACWRASKVVGVTSAT